MNCDRFNLSTEDHKKSKKFNNVILALVIELCSFIISISVFIIKIKKY